MFAVIFKAEVGEQDQEYLDMPSSYASWHSTSTTAKTLWL